MESQSKTFELNLIDAMSNWDINSFLDLLWQFEWENPIKQTAHIGKILMDVASDRLHNECRLIEVLGKIQLIYQERGYLEGRVNEIIGVKFTPSKILKDALTSTEEDVESVSIHVHKVPQANRSNCEQKFGVEVKKASAQVEAGRRPKQGE
jgi:hypothetical protein